MTYNLTKPGGREPVVHMDEQAEMTPSRFNILQRVQQTPVPARMAGLPRDKRGFPVPAVFLWEHGQPNFAVLDMYRWGTVVINNLCAICGQANDDSVFFIGGIMSYENRVFMDPAMHEECARYAMKVCPYLALPNTKHKETSDKYHKSAGHAAAFGHVDKPEKMGLFWTSGYDIICVDPGDILARRPPDYKVYANEFVGAEWYDNAGQPTKPPTTEEIESRFAEFQDLAPNNTIRVDHKLMAGISAKVTEQKSRLGDADPIPPLSGGLFSRGKTPTSRKKQMGRNGGKKKRF